VRCALSVVTTDESSHKTSEGDPLLRSGALGWHGKRTRQTGQPCEHKFCAVPTRLKTDVSVRRPKEVSGHKDRRVSTPRRTSCMRYVIDTR